MNIDSGVSFLNLSHDRLSHSHVKAQPDGADKQVTAGRGFDCGFGFTVLGKRSEHWISLR